MRMPITFLAVAMSAGALIAQQPLPTQTVQKQSRTVQRPEEPAILHGERAISTAQSGSLHSEPRPTALPSFQATTMDGKTTDVASQAKKGHWLLLYRPEKCPPCDKLQAALAASQGQSYNGGARYVIVVANHGDTHGGNRLDALRATYPTMSAATWLEDSKGTALQVLKPKGYPMLYAMHGRRLAWSVPGSLGDPSRVERLADAWLSSSPDPALDNPTVPSAVAK